MARTIPSVEPTSVTAGESWDWNVTRLGDYLASSSWTLTYFLQGETPFEFTAATASDGDTFEVRFTPAQTKKIKPGSYRLYGRVTDGTSTDQVYSRVLYIAADPATARSAQSDSEKTLAILRAKINGRYESGIESYQIDGVSVVHMSMDTLHRHLSNYISQVNQERFPNRLGRSIGVVFPGLS